MQKLSMPLKSIRDSWHMGPYLVVLPCMLLYGVFFYYATAKGFAYSLTDWDGISLSYSFVGLKNYADAFHSKALASTIRFTILFLVLVVMGTNLLGCILALLLDARIKLRGFFRSLFFLPAMMSSLTIAYVFQQIDYRVITELGVSMGNSTLANGLLTSTTWAPIYVSFVQIWLSTAVTTLIYLAGLQAVPQDVLESGRIDGANGWQMFFRIKLPLMIPSLTINLINTTKTAISAFDIVMGTTKGGPMNSTYSFAMYMYLMYSDLELAYSCAIAMIMFVLFGAIALAQIVALRKREVTL